MVAARCRVGFFSFNLLWLFIKLLLILPWESEAFRVSFTMHLRGMVRSRIWSTPYYNYPSSTPYRVVISASGLHCAFTMELV